MNKRIKELIKAAGGIGHDDDGNELTPMLVGSGLEKFADLLLEEVMQTLFITGHESAFDELNKHFGVK